ncbi:hypothetical protein AXF42_Ash016138 [Apostasia shenzhenica]|uniref:Uncharacterized protein n=1 Tax=Apostasia shenzhenica TaxID=1088818 RepID=A0A2I0AEL4_9ASPA|nr:hypothetical protein AXF42_Ash016138 [Apostasia shenzhenica]
MNGHRRNRQRPSIAGSVLPAAGSSHRSLAEIISGAGFFHSYRASWLLLHLPISLGHRTPRKYQRVRLLRAESLDRRKPPRSERDGDGDDSEVRGIRFRTASVEWKLDL